MLLQGIRNERGEYKEWLHCFNVAAEVDGNRVSRYHRFPWPRPGGMEQPDYDAIIAFYHVTKFKGWPDAWQDFANIVLFFPIYSFPMNYWIVLPTHREETLYTIVAGHRDAAHSEVFKRVKGCTVSEDSYRQAIRDAFLSRLERYKIRRTK
jgi:hypothetical protein